MSDRENNDINLTQANAGLKKLLIGAGWEFTPYDGEPLDIDLCCFALGKDDQTREDEDFVFYNNPQGAALAIKHLGDNRTGMGDGDDEAILIDFDNLSFDVWRIVFVVSIYQGDDSDRSFADLQQMTIRAENAETGHEIHRMTIDGKGKKGVTAIKMAEIYRQGVEWHFVPMDESIEGGLGAIAKSYGLLISSTT